MQLVVHLRSPRDADASAVPRSICKFWGTSFGNIWNFLKHKKNSSGQPTKPNQSTLEAVLETKATKTWNHSQQDQCGMNHGRNDWSSFWDKEKNEKDMGSVSVYCVCVCGCVCWLGLLNVFWTFCGFFPFYTSKGPNSTEPLSSVLFTFRSDSFKLIDWLFVRLMFLCTTREVVKSRWSSLIFIFRLPLTVATIYWIVKCNFALWLYIYIYIYPWLPTSQTQERSSFRNFLESAMGQDQLLTRSSRPSLAQTK